MTNRDLNLELRRPKEQGLYLAFSFQFIPIILCWKEQLILGETKVNFMGKSEQRKSMDMEYLKKKL